MLNRALQVRVVKNDENGTKSGTDGNFAMQTYHITQASKSIGADVAKLMFLYIALDTARKVIVAKASQ